MTETIVAVTRHCPSTHQSVILVSHTAFNHPPPAIPTQSNPNTHYEHVPPLTVPGQLSEVILEARLVKKDESKGEEFKQSSNMINGLESHILDMRKHISLPESHMCCVVSEKNGNTQKVVFTDFCPGSIIIFRLVVELL